MPLNVSKAEVVALNRLCKNRDIIIIRPDKGNGIVILNRSDYINKVLDILDDSSKFLQLNTDSLEICQKRENKLIRLLRDNLLKNKYITEEVYRELFPSGSTPGILYGLPKVHKPDCPARPILSAIGTYNYKLAKFLVPILQPFTHNSFTVKDSFSFVNEISSFHNNSLHMASFDVCSLFTNIPLDECIQLCTDTLFQNRDSILYNDCTFDRSNFKKLLSSAVKNNHFIFNGQLWDQLDGVAMGSPLGPTLANIFMNALETRYLDECPPEFKPVLYRRYVDDTFCLFKEHAHIDSFLQHINSFHPNIKFTVEVEKDNSLPFLDVSILKNRDSFSTSLYRKSTFTGLYADFASLIPNKYKINLINVLIYRAFHICSTYTNFHKELCNIKAFLHDNRFPKSLIDRIIRTFLNNQFSKNRKTPSQTDDKQRILFFFRS